MVDRGLAFIQIKVETSYRIKSRIYLDNRIELSTNQQGDDHQYQNRRKRYQS